MIRSRTGLITKKFRLQPGEWKTLGAYATALGLTIEGGRYRGLPDHTAALRDLIREADLAMAREADPDPAGGQGSSTRG